MLELLRTEQQLHALARLGVGDRVAASLEAEQPITSDDAGGALDHEIGRGQQRSQRRMVTISAGRDDLAVGAVHTPAGDVLVPILPRHVRLRIACEAVRA